MIKKILYLSDYQGIIYHLTAKTFIKQQTFQHDKLVDFIAYLQNRDRTPLVVLVDTAQEEYQIQRLPHVLGKDRRDQLQHKIQRLFERTPYTYAVVQGREKTGRGDDQVLFLALNNQEILATWINILVEHKIPLIGIYSVPLLSQSLLKHFVLPTKKIDNNYLLLLNHTPAISVHHLQGLRQTFFIDQKFQLSRLIPLNITQPTEYAEYIINQLTRTQQYLHSKRLLPQQAILVVIILTQESFLSHLLTQFKQQNLSNIKLYPVDINYFLPTIPITAESYYLHYLLAHLVIKRLPKNHYAKFDERRYFIFKQLRTVLYTISLLLLSSAVVMSNSIWQKSIQLTEKIQVINHDIQQQQTMLAQQRAEVPILPIDLAHFRNIVETGQYITARHIQHQKMWKKISEVLIRYPTLLLTELEWGVGTSSEQIFTATLEEQEVEKDNSIDAISSATMYPDENEEAGVDFIEGVRLQGKISPFDGNYRVALKLYNDFVVDLQQVEAAWTVEKTAPPYNTKLRQGQIGSQVEVTEAPFAVKILLKYGD